jgi:hypothetical protein
MGATIGEELLIHPKHMNSPLSHSVVDRQHNGQKGNKDKGKKTNGKRIIYKTLHRK